MNFFEQQDRAHRNTRYLVALLCMAVISLIAVTTLLIGAVIYYGQLNSRSYLQHLGVWEGITHALTWKLVAEISLGVVAVIFLGSLYKLFQLSSGGRAVAEALGGHPINLLNANPDEKKILNVVEEMAIASGTPVPPVYVLEDDAINAFAAGHNPQDAVIGVTRGCIRVLNRDELQGVIAHEFSHIFHGDMKLNMRLVALLNGILLLGLIGEFLFRNAGNTAHYRSNRDKSPFAMMGLGLGLMIIGYAGTFFGSLIKSAVSRQREFLADASAVKFTRNPDGIGGALKKLAGYVGGSQMDVANAAEFSHMFFGEGVSSAFSGFATHPPISERIRRIFPNWDGKLPHIDVQARDDSSYMDDGSYTDNSSYIKEERENATQGPLEFTSPKTAVEFAVTVNQVMQSIGQPDQAHLAYARQTLTQINDRLHNAAHNPWEAQALVFGLLLDKNLTAQEKQWQLLAPVFSDAQLNTIKPLAREALSLAPQLRLPLIELTLPALKQLSLDQYQQFKKAMTLLIRADNQISLLEWSFFRIVTHNLEPKKTTQRMVDLAQLEHETTTLLSVIANAGASSPMQAQAAFDGSKILLGFEKAKLLQESEYDMMDLDLAINRLNSIKPLQKPKLLKAMSQCVLADQQVTIVEAELFRAMADALDCPVPPLIVGSSATRV